MTNIQELATKLLKQSKQQGVDYADVRASTRNTTTFRLHNGKFESPLVQGENFGVGVRVIHKGKLGFYSTNLKSGSSDAVRRALKLAKANPSKQRVKLARAKPVKDEYTVKAKKPVTNYSVDDKVKLAKDLTAAAQGGSVRAIDMGYSDATGQAIFVSTEGSRIVKTPGRTLISANITAKSGARLEQTRARIGGFGFEKYNTAVSKVKEKAKLACDLLKARVPKGGSFDSVLDLEAAGVFAHEAVGHACEADAVLNDGSVLKGKLGKSIGSDAVSISDSPTFGGEWGSYKYDSEGVPAQHTKLIVGGKLKRYLQSRTTAAKLGMKPTGNGRAQSYGYAPIVRMSNTFFEGGDYSNSELLKEIKNGYLLRGFRGGQVETKRGKFTFACEAAREIKNGKKGKLLKGCTFGGTILGTLHNVFGCAKFNKQMDIGWCGKGGQLVPAGTGGCFVGVKQLHIGGGK